MRRLIPPFILAIGLHVALMALLLRLAPSQATSALAADRCVNMTGAGGCFTSIQAAINASAYGDVIHVDTGVYTEHITMKSGVSVHGQGWVSTTIHGGYSGPTATVFFSGAGGVSITASTVLSGVRITGGGTGVITTSTQDGGGIAIWGVSPSIVNIWVDSCTARYGGGVFVSYGSSPTFNNVPVWRSHASAAGGGFALQGPNTEVTIAGDFNGTNGTIWSNSAADEGGGVWISNGVTATLAGLRIYLNVAGMNHGGGVYIYQNPNRVTLMLNDISANSANRGGGIGAYNAADLLMIGNGIGSKTFGGNTAALDGGGAFFQQSAGLLQSTLFFGNRAANGSGGGANISTSSGPALVTNLFEGNSASANGGGLAIEMGAAPLVDSNSFVTNTASLGGGISFYQSGVATFTNNIVARNVSTAPGLMGGLQLASSPARIVNNTVVSNTGSGIWFKESNGMAIVNNIVVSNTTYGIEQDSATTTPISTTDYNDVYGNTSGNYYLVGAGVHDMSVNPRFVAASPDLAAYYHIQASSPVSTTGSPAWAPGHDIDGQPRFSDGKVSMGADEIAATIALAKTPDNQTVASGDTVTFTIYVTNTGDLSLAPITVTDALAPGCDDTHASLGVGAAYSYTCAIANVTASFTNPAVVTGASAAGPAVASDEAHVAVLSSNIPGIALAKAPHNQTVESGDTVAFTIYVTNTGDLPLSPITVTDVLAPGCNRTIASLGAGLGTSYPCTLADVTAAITNVATAAGASAAGLVSAGDEAHVAVLSPHIALVKAPHNQTVESGGTVTFTIYVTNTGDLPLAPITMTDVLAPGCNRIIASLGAGLGTSYPCTLTNVTAAFTNVATAAGASPSGRIVTASDDAGVALSNPGAGVYLPIILRAN